jgi:antitoxin ParD1/3/4
VHVSLTPKLDSFVKGKVRKGDYNNASEVVREALRLMQEHEDLRRLKLKRLRAAIAKGDDDLKTGRSKALRTDEDIAEFFARL